jgi:hypothetical protein
MPSTAAPSNHALPDRGFVFTKGMSCSTTTDSVIQPCIRNAPLKGGIISVYPAPGEVAESVFGAFATAVKIRTARPRGSTSSYYPCYHLKAFRYSICRHCQRYYDINNKG